MTDEDEMACCDEFGLADKAGAVASDDACLNSVL